MSENSPKNCQNKLNMSVNGKGKSQPTTLSADGFVSWLIIYFTGQQKEFQKLKEHDEVELDNGVQINSGLGFQE